jgi:hypothetical protein
VSVPFRSLPSTIGATDAARLRDAVRTRIATRVLPAQQKFKRFMTETYLPAAPGEVGLRSLPSGLALYEYFLRTNTTTNLHAGQHPRFGSARSRPNPPQHECASNPHQRGAPAATIRDTLGHASLSTTAFRCARQPRPKGEMSKVLRPPTATSAPKTS